MQLNLLVIRTKNLELLKNQYELLGFNFDYHRHGKGPFHFSADRDGFVLEIYPLNKSNTEADNSLRLGFKTKNLEQIVRLLEKSNWKIIAPMKNTEWGEIVVIQDLDGRKIELLQD